MVATGLLVVATMARKPIADRIATTSVAGAFAARKTGPFKAGNARHIAANKFEAVSARPSIQAASFFSWLLTFGG